MHHGVRRSRPIWDLETRQTFGVTTTNGARFDVTKLAPMLEDLRERLAGVVIECLDFAEFISRYDRPHTLFYIDPPYWGCEGDYGKKLFERCNFERLNAALTGLQGRFILSLKDVPEVRETFGAFNIEPVETRYTVSGAANATRAKELIITGS